MNGMQEAVERIERAIATHEPILLYGDYDVDGTTAVVLLKTAIEMLGGIVRFHVPHRLLEGYGLQSSVIEAAYADGVRLVITVDTGMRAFAEAETARRLGLDLIITDHHLTAADDSLPLHLALLNPNQPGCGVPGEIAVRRRHRAQAGAGAAGTPRCGAHPRENSAQLSQDGGHCHHR